MNGVSPQAWHEKALVAERSGDVAQALDLIAQGLTEHGNAPDLLNSAGNIHMRAQQFADAAKRFGQAAEAAPSRIDLALNHAIALNRLSRFEEALAALAPFPDEGAKNPQFGSVAGTAARGAGQFADAARYYDAAIALDPARAKALHGRARVALERGETDALARFDAALAVNPGDADLWLGKAQALDAAGDADGATTIARQLVAQAPHWDEGLKFLAQLRLASGDPDYTSHYADAAQTLPQDPNIPYLHASILAQNEHYAAAAEITRQARSRFPDMAQFALLDAVQSGAAGDNARAGAIFSTLALDTVDRHVQESRYNLRIGDAEAALACIDKALAKDAWDQPAWALRLIGWRLTDDARLDWLLGKGHLAKPMTLLEADDVLPPAIAVLDQLHDASPFPLGQSLRGGTQTRGSLFARMEPELAALEDAITQTIAAYRAALPPQDDTHPLLRHRDAPWQLKGSWSVRLSGGRDHHASHVHPQGILSSALYLRPPELQDDDHQAGWLELGRPPSDLGLTLEPLNMIEPEAGALALFPSYLYHGTRPFASGTRLTVAFDVAPHTGIA